MSTLAVGFAVFGFGILGIFVLVLWIAGLVDVFTKRPDLDRGQRAGWVLLIVLLPLVGTIWYFIRRPMAEDEKEKMLESAVRRRGR